MFLVLCHFMYVCIMYHIQHLSGSPDILYIHSSPLHCQSTQITLWGSVIVVVLWERCGKVTGTLSRLWHVAAARHCQVSFLGSVYGSGITLSVCPSCVTRRQIGNHILRNDIVKVNALSWHWTGECEALFIL